MSAVLVDSNVLLDVITEDEAWFEWSSAQLIEAAQHFKLVINPVIYAEVSVRYSTAEELESVLPRHAVERQAIPYEAAFLAGKVFAKYRKRGGPRLAPLPDFFIGAHAAVAGYKLLTRDARRYRQDFPRLDLITP